jgi:choline monooxygenase
MNRPLSQKISVSQLAAVNQPIAQATGMPNAAYTDREFFYFERDHVLGATWTALVFCNDFQENNTVTPVEFMGLPLIIARNRQGALKVFHNVCSHRGRILVNETKKTNGMVVCPYHCWTYDFDGKLRATPHIGGVGIHQADGFCQEKHGLKEVRSHIWLGVLFINLSGDAPEFREHTGPLQDRYQEFVGDNGFEEIRYAKSNGALSLDIECNWKLAMENFCESYHLPWVHPDLNKYSPFEKHSDVYINDDFAGQRTTCFDPSITGCESLPNFPNWPKEQSGCAEYPAFYPNLMLGFQENHLFMLIATPIDFDRTREDLRLIYVNDDAANGNMYKPARIANHAAWEKVFREDVTSVEGLQLGRNSPGYTGGAFSPVHDGLTLHFHKWLAGKYQAAYEENTAA